MAQLLVTGPEPSQTWRRVLPESKAIRLGRAPHDGWAIPWDNRISREHAEVELRDGELRVQRLETGRNPIFVAGAATAEFCLKSGEEFRIGHTTFRFSLEDQDETLEIPCHLQNLDLSSLSHYNVNRKLGAGGMAAVFLATDSRNQRTVALKVLAKDKAEDPMLVRRFRSEAQAAAQLKHENIVRIFDFGAADGYLFMALEYVEGTDVERLIAEHGRLPARQSLEIVKQTARALQHAHQQNIVHRDIKPSNLLIRRDGTVKLADMGLARSVDQTTDMNITRAGTTVGTVDYMSAEQAQNSKAADVRSDIYSLGCSWYHMLTGQPPYPEGGLTNRLHAHATQPPPDPRQFNNDVPEVMVAVLHRMMAKQPADRYQTPDELLEDLENAALTREELSNNVLAGLAGDTDPGLGSARPHPPSDPLRAVLEDSDVDESEPARHRPTVVSASLPPRTQAAVLPSVDPHDGASAEFLAVQCEQCQRRYRVRTQAAGKRFKCKTCGHIIAVPAQ